MTTEQTPAAPARRRMAGHTPLATEPPGPGPAPQGGVGQDPGPARTGATPPPGPTPAAGGTTPAAAKTRMGGTTAAPAARTRMGGGAAPGAAAMAPGAPAPAAKSRMGGTPAAPAARTRMGGAPAQPSVPAAAQAPTAPAAPRSRMGGAPAAAASAPASAPSAPPSPSAPPAPSATRSAGRPAWVRPVAIIAGVVVLAALVVLGARWLRTLEGVQGFIATYDGHSTQPAATPEGMPWWMGWQHFFNMFLIVLIIRTGLQVRTERKPPGYWTARKGSFFSPKANTPKKVSLTQWLHQALDVLWVANGLVFVVLLFATGHWARIVPTDWDIVPNMASAGLQYASLDWPAEDGWVHYNALQVVAYFTTVFVAAPLAVASGIRFSTWWPQHAERLNRVYPVEWARAVHFPVMLYFVGFTVVHVLLVFLTGALANLNHMYTSRDVVDWWGLVVFLASVVVIAAAWFLAKPMFTTPLAARTGTVSK
jgi:thiosulfate reductase cytochrome b subunit